MSFELLSFVLLLLAIAAAPWLLVFLISLAALRSIQLLIYRDF